MKVRNTRWRLGYLYIIGMILLTVYGQMVIKWRVNLAGPLPATPPEIAAFLFNFTRNPWVISGLAAGFFAFLSWTMALTYFELSFAYPFASLSFVLVLTLSILFLGETPTLPKIIGVLLILAGLFISSRS